MTRNTLYTINYAIISNGQRLRTGDDLSTIKIRGDRDGALAMFEEIKANPGFDGGGVTEITGLKGLTIIAA